ncbi:metal-sensing transcriptional repressor, partial [Phycicoccus sp. DTK01]
SALNRALEGVALGLMDDHLAHCVLDAARAGEDEGAAKLKEASDAIRRLVRS